MREPRGTKLQDRLENARQAKQNLLKKAREAPGADDPAVIEQRAAKRSAAAARAAERAQRAEAKAAAVRYQANLEAAEAEAAAARKVALEAAQKAARDARYAGRKNRQKR